MTEREQERAAVVAALNKRLAIYRQKRAKADPFAEETFNRHEALTYVIEAIELLAMEMGLADAIERGEHIGKE